MLFSRKTILFFILVILITGSGLNVLSPGGTIHAAADDETGKTPQLRYSLMNPPIKRQKTEYYPLKEMASLLDLQVLLNQTTGQIEVTGITRAVRLTPGSSTAAVSLPGGKKQNLDLGAAIFVNNGIAYAPASLFSKVFSVPVSIYYLKGKEISLAYQTHYIFAADLSQLFWVSRPGGDVYTGKSGEVPVLAGNIKQTELDWFDLNVRQTGPGSYLLDINNSHGEPHVNVDWYRVIVNNNKIVKQSVMSFSDMQMENYLFKNAQTMTGYVLLNDGHHFEFDTPDGKTVLKYNLDSMFGTTDDIYSVEVADHDFFIIRRYAFGDPFFVDRVTMKPVSLYDLLFSPDEAAAIKERKPEVLDSKLTYTGRTGSTLHFNWGNSQGSETIDWQMPPLK